MTFFTELPFRLENTWIFAAIYLLATSIIMLSFPKHFKKRLLTAPTFSSRFQKVLFIIGIVIFSRGLFIYSIVVPFKLWSVWFWIGLPIYSFGLIGSVIAMLNYAKTEKDKPVVIGIYRLSRHPMQIMAVVMWIGIGIISASWVIILMAFILGIISFPSLVAQEKDCLKIYGDPYKVYMNRTPRFLFLNK